MADVTIRDKSTGREFTGPTGQAIPDGYEVVQPKSGITDTIKQGYQAARDFVGKGIDMLDVTPEARKAAGQPKPSEQYNPLPPNLASGVAQTAVGVSNRLPILRDLPGPIQRVLAGALGGEAGGQLEGKRAGVGALEGGAPAVVGEGIGAAGSAAARVMPGAKARINEGQSQELLDTIGQTNRVARRAIEAAPVSDLQREPRTAAAIKRGFESGAVGDAASQRFDATLNRVATAAGNPGFNTPALIEAHAMMPPLEQRLLGAPGPNGFTLQQAQQIRSWVGDPAFRQSTLGQGVRAVPQQRLWGEITQEIENGISHAPRALQLWQANNHTYGGTQALQDALTQGNAFQGQPNRTFLNRSALSEYFAKNEVDLRRRLGDEGYDSLVNQVLGGAQPGTRDLVAPGSGTAASGLLSWLRGTNTGATQAARLPLTTAAPNLGSQYTGRQPYALPELLQRVLDAGAIRQSEPARKYLERP